MDPFLLKFFPNVYMKKHRAKESNYCKFDDQRLQLFTSSLYLSTVICCWVAAYTCKRFGRKRTMQMAVFFFFLDIILNAAAVNIWMLIIGRLLLGADIDFSNQAVSLFISEIALAKYRGALNICFQLLVTVGILIANFVNYFTSTVPHGWRISLGLSGFPAVFLDLGSILITKMRTSLNERGHKTQGLDALRRIRGMENVEREFEELVYASEIANEIKHPYRTLMKRSSFLMLLGRVGSNGSGGSSPLHG